MREHTKSKSSMRPAKGGKTVAKSDTTNDGEGSGHPKMWAGEGSYVEEAMKGAKERKRGGRMRKGKEAMQVHGSAAHRRLDRPGRKRGGGVGADMKPMTEAAKLTGPQGGKLARDKIDAEDD